MDAGVAGFAAALDAGRVAVAVRAAPVVLFAADVAGCEKVTALSAALVFGVAGAVGVAGVSVVSTVADAAVSVAGVSALGARTNETFCDLAVGCEGRAVVCDRRAACA